MQGSVEDLGFGESGPGVRTSICCLQGQTLAGSTGLALGPGWAFATTRMRFLVGYIYIYNVYVYIFIFIFTQASAGCWRSLPRAGPSRVGPSLCEVHDSGGRTCRSSMGINMPCQPIRRDLQQVTEESIHSPLMQLCSWLQL